MPRREERTSGHYVAVARNSYRAPSPKCATGRIVLTVTIAARRGLLSIRGLTGYFFPRRSWRQERDKGGVRAVPKCVKVRTLGSPRMLLS